MPVIVLSCSCRHPYQDSRYGPGIRLHNLRKDPKQARCSVCSTTRQVGSSQPAKVEIGQEKQQGKRAGREKQDNRQKGTKR